MFRTIDCSALNQPRIGIGVVGYGFMGKVHSNAYLKIPYTYASPEAYPELVAMAGRSEDALVDTARRFGYRGVYTDWRALVEDPEVQIVDNCTPDDLHAEVSIAALRAGKHVVCEKPLAMTAADAQRMRDTALQSGRKHLLCHNYRFMPAVRLARQLIEEGRLGRIYQFRGRYLQQIGHDPDETTEDVWYATGTRSGVLLGIGCHIIDLARFLVGEVQAVSGLVKTFNRTRADRSGRTETVSADEVNYALVEFAGGAVGTLESAGISTGRKNQCTWEINGSKGSLLFDLEDLNHLQVCLEGGAAGPAFGFSNVSVTGPNHPLQAAILPPGHNAGWEYGHVHALHHLLEAVAKDRKVEPYGATFEDGYRIQVVMEAIVNSAKIGGRVEVSFA
ncbi:MAG: Gfo/Idh/MocA family oxidoreductase [Spirochaetales bacterium]|nr:Gfo/Idh/MocA family oxidoreductase [Spirochaetales bacterium]